MLTEREKQTAYSFLAGEDGVGRVEVAEGTSEAGLQAASLRGGDRFFANTLDLLNGETTNKTSSNKSYEGGLETRVMQRRHMWRGGGEGARMSPIHSAMRFESFN